MRVRFIDVLNRVLGEDAPTNAAGSGNVAGLGVGPSGEPGRRTALLKKLRMIRRNKKK